MYAKEGPIIESGVVGYEFVIMLQDIKKSFFGNIIIIIFV